MLTVEIGINGEDLYRAEAYLQGGDLGGLCTYKIVINGEEAGVVTHDRTDLAWVLAGLILARFPTPEKTLQEEGGARTALPPNALRQALSEYDALEWAQGREAAASAKLALEEGQ